MKNYEIYKCADFFMARYANLPFGFHSIADNDNIEDILEFYEKNVLFKEAIAISNFDLHKTLQTIQTTKNEKSKKKIFYTLIKYLIRMSTRATPFGLFSSVSWGRFGDKTSMNFDPSLLNKKVRLSMECLDKLKKYIHDKQYMVRNLNVMINPLIIKKYKRIYLHKNSNTSTENYISIKKTSAFDYLSVLAKAPIKYKILEEKMINYFPNINNIKITDYLWKLFLSDYLISEIANPVSFSNSELFFFNELQSIESFSNDSIFLILKEILAEIEEYEKISDEKSILKLNIIFDKIKSWNNEANNPLRLDSFYNSNNILLHKNIQKAIEKTAYIFARLSSKNELPEHLIDFHKFFIEKYGTDRLIPFSEMMCNDRLNDFLSIENKKTLSNINIIDSFLSLQMKAEEIDIQEIIQNLPILTQNELEQLTTSAELYFEIAAPSDEDIDNNNFKLIVKGISPQAGASFGRFFYSWDHNKIDAMRNFIKNEEKLLPNVIFAESTFLPDKIKAANVSNSEKLRLIQLPMHYYKNDDSTIDLEDLYVGATNEKLYVFSKKLKKEILFCSNIMTNPLLLPFPFRLLLFFSQYYFSNFWGGFVLEPFQNSAYIPRIKYQNIILSPAKWYLDYSCLNLKNDTSDNEIKLKLEEALIKYKVPYRIQLSENDNNLLLNWSIPHHFEIIFRHFIKNKKLSIIENIIKENDLFVGKEKHVCEFVVPLVKNQSYTPEASIRKYPTIKQINVLDRMAVPGSDWLYAKIFLSSEDNSIFLKSHFFSYINFITKKYDINKWFYICYKEESFHLRLRLNAKANILNNCVLPDISKWIADLLENEIIKNFSLCTYEKEIERYGGPACFSLAEDFFCVDSYCCCQLLSEIDESLPIYIIASFGIINILRYFYSDIESMLKFSFQEEKYLALLDGIRSHSKKAFYYITALFFEENNIVEKTNFLNFLNNCYINTYPVLNQLSSKVNILLEEKKLWGTKENLVNSLIHMHCNRLMGISHVFEMKARIAAFYFLKKVKFIKNNNSILSEKLSTL